MGTQAERGRLMTTYPRLGERTDYRGLTDEAHAANRQAGVYVCRCANPDPDVIGECSHCRRLIASTVRPQERSS